MLLRSKNNESDGTKTKYSSNITVASKIFKH